MRKKVYAMSMAIVLAGSLSSFSVGASDAEVKNTSEVVIHQYMLEGKEAAEEAHEAEVASKRAIEIKKNRKAIDNELKRAKKEQLALAKKKAAATQKVKLKMQRASKQMKKLRLITKKRAKTTAAVSTNNTNATVFTIGSAGNSSRKCWMPHKSVNGGSIFSTGTPQWNLQQKAYTGAYGIRMVKGRYCIAMGSRFSSKIGTKIDIQLKNGKNLPCILGDQKANKDTDSTNSYDGHGCYVEFIVDRSNLNSVAKQQGWVSKIPAFSGKIAKVVVYG